jgi:hypothetical protein
VSAIRHRRRRIRGIKYVARAAEFDLLWSYVQPVMVGRARTREQMRRLDLMDITMTNPTQITSVRFASPKVAHRRLSVRFGAWNAAKDVARFRPGRSPV